MAGLDNIFAGLSTDPHMASFELLQRINSTTLQGAPGEIQYTAACGTLEAFYEAMRWKAPEGIILSPVASSAAASRSNTQ
jgi:hypothetical protein